MGLVGDGGLPLGKKKPAWNAIARSVLSSCHRRDVKNSSSYVTCRHTPAYPTVLLTPAHEHVRRLLVGATSLPWPREAGRSRRP